MRKLFTLLALLAFASAGWGQTWEANHEAYSANSVWSQILFSNAAGDLGVRLRSLDQTGLGPAQLPPAGYREAQVLSQILYYDSSALPENETAIGVFLVGGGGTLPTSIGTNQPLVSDGAGAWQESIGTVAWEGTTTPFTISSSTLAASGPAFYLDAQADYGTTDLLLRVRENVATSPQNILSLYGAASPAQMVVHGDAQLDFNYNTDGLVLAGVSPRPFHIWQSMDGGPPFNRGYTLHFDADGDYGSGPIDDDYLVFRHKIDTGGEDIVRIDHRGTIYRSAGYNYSIGYQGYTASGGSVDVGVDVKAGRHVEAVGHITGGTLDATGGPYTESSLDSAVFRGPYGDPDAEPPISVETGAIRIATGEPSWHVQVGDYSISSGSVVEVIADGAITRTLTEGVDFQCVSAGSNWDCVVNLSAALAAFPEIESYPVHHYPGATVSASVYVNNAFQYTVTTVPPMGGGMSQWRPGDGRLEATLSGIADFLAGRIEEPMTVYSEYFGLTQSLGLGGYIIFPGIEFTTPWDWSTGTFPLGIKPLFRFSSNNKAQGLLDLYADGRSLFYTAVDFDGITAAVGNAGEGRIVFDGTANRFKVSENGGALANLVLDGTSPSFVDLTLTGSAVSYTNTGGTTITSSATATNPAIIWDTANNYSSAQMAYEWMENSADMLFNITGRDGGAVNATASLYGYLDLQGAAALAGAAGEGRLFYNSSTNKLQASENGAAAVDFALYGDAPSFSGLTLSGTSASLSNTSGHTWTSAATAGNVAFSWDATNDYSAAQVVARIREDVGGTPQTLVEWYGAASPGTMKVYGTIDSEGIEGSKTWDDGGTVYHLHDYSITDTDSAAGSTLLRYRMDGVPVLEAQNGALYGGSKDYLNFSCKAKTRVQPIASSSPGQSMSVGGADATAGDTNPGAAAGGDMNVVAGDAARLTSGDANGGNINLITGAGIGSGSNGTIEVFMGGGSTSVLTIGNGYITGSDDGFGAFSVKARKRSASGMSLFGLPVEIGASDAVPGTDTPGAADGGDVEIYGGNAARYTSGDGDGGNVLIYGGDSIGSGNAGSVILANNGTDDKGYVGIGIATPDTLLHVDGHGKFTPTSSNVSNPPTDAELDTLYTGPATVGDGWMTFLEDSDSNNFYIITSDGSNWYVFTGTIAS